MSDTENTTAQGQFGLTSDGQTADAPKADVASSGSGKRRIIAVVAAVVVLLIAVGAGVAWANYTRTPAYALSQLANSVKNKDWNGVEKYVDVESVFGKAIDAAMSKTLKEDASGMGAFAAGLAQAMKPALIQQAKDGFKKSVEQGSTSATDSASFATYFSAASIKAVDYIGDEAVVTVVAPNSPGKPFDLKLRMKRVGDHWRITAIENILDLPANSSASTAGAAPSQPVKTTGTRESPVPVGTVARIGDWEVTVVQVAQNADYAVKKANEFNEKPAKGSQYVMVTVKAKYLGEKSGTFWVDTGTKFYGSDGNTFDSASVVSPKPISETGETFPNAVVTGNMVFVVPSAQVAGGSVIMEQSFAMDDSSRTFFALK